VCFVAVEVVELVQAIARVLKRKEIGAGRRVTFGTGIAIPSVVVLPGSRSLASTALCSGGCDHASWPPRASHKAFAALTITAAAMWFPAPATSHMEGVRLILHFHGEPKQFKIGLLLDFSELPRSVLHL
jgi:hypothetical protein